MRCYLISCNYNRFHRVLLCEPTHPAANVLPPACFHIPLVIFCSTIFSLHKQCLQSESALIKGTNLSRSNQVAALASAADNSRLFDQKYIILGRLPACLDGFVWGQEIGEVIAPFWCSSPLLRLLAGKMKATPVRRENTPNELSGACWVQREQPAPISPLNLYTLPVHNGTEDIVNFSFLCPCRSWWNETLAEIVCRCNWGQLQKHPSLSSLFSNLGSNNMVFPAMKRKANVWASVRTPSPPLLSNPSLAAKGIF